MVGIDAASFGDAAQTIVALAEHHGQNPYDRGYGIHFYTFNLNGVQSASVSGRMGDYSDTPMDHRQLELYIRGADRCSMLTHLIVERSVRKSRYEASVMWAADALQEATGKAWITDEMVQDAMTLFARLGGAAACSMVTRATEISIGILPMGPEAINADALPFVPFDWRDLSLPGVEPPALPPI